VSGLAYLVNSYPMPSLTFIRREIAALEADGIPVVRYAVRDLDLPRLDPEDQAEHDRTRRLLDAGASGLAGATLATLVTRPRHLLRALRATVRLGRASERGGAVHLVYLAEACLLRQWAARDDVGHIHVHFGTNGATVALLAHLLGGPTYSITIHGPEEFDAPGGLALGEKVHHADFVAAITNYARSQLWRWARPEDWSKIHIIHCGLDDGFLLHEPADPPTAPRLVSIGRLTAQKGQLVLVDAIGELRRRGSDVHLTLIGDGELRGLVEARIAKLGLGEQIELAGWRSGADVRDALVASRALVLSSFAEGLPVVIMEALALERPVVSTTIAGIPELVRQGESGWLVPAGSVPALADALEEVLAAAPAELKRMGAAGARRVAEDHDVRIEARRLAALFPASVTRPRGAA